MNDMWILAIGAAIAGLVQGISGFAFAMVAMAIAPMPRIGDPVASHPKRNGREAEEKGQDRQAGEGRPAKD